MRLPAWFSPSIGSKEKTVSYTHLDVYKRQFYYRENSAASHLSPKDLKEEMLQQAELLYLTGITPVLSESCERTVREAIRLGKKHG